MKLVFSKNEKHEISVVSKDGDSETEFNYISMIKKLIDTKQLEDPEFDGDFSDSEKESVRSMINHINQEAADFYSDEEE
ncbi:hypothetical protein AAEJ42_13700 [Shewanella algae]|uniref:hypothetical protein n=1 Tax=Shewanella algae TaxID=38313 RepID=UPI0030048695